MKLRSIRPWRRAVQLGVFLAFIAIPFLNKAEYNALAGNFLAFNFAGLPLGDPLAALQVAAGTFSATSAMLAGAGMALALAFFMGPVFCAWICPFGFLSELAHRKKDAPPACARPGTQKTEAEAAQSSAPASKTFGANDSAPATCAPKSFAAKDSASKGSAPAAIRPFAFKLGIVAAGLLAVLLLAPVPLLNQLSMPGWYSRAMQHLALYREPLWGAVIAIPLVLLAERIAGRRFWCRWICPQSVLIALAGLVFPKRFQVRFARRACTCPATDRACLNSCSLGLNPRKPTAAQRAQCSNCGDCIDACACRGKALNFRFGPGDGHAPKAGDQAKTD